MMRSVIGAVVLGFLVTPALADVDCTAPAFAEFVEDAKFSCQEDQTATVTGFANDVVLRSVHDAKDPGAAEAEGLVFAAVQEALVRMAALDSGMPLQLQNVTIAIMGATAKSAMDLPSRPVLGAATPYEGDCVFRIYPQRIAEQGMDGLGVLQTTVAHELFHCVQYATWPDLMAEFSNHNWWVEGTAETVSQAVFPNYDFAFKEGQRFADKFRDTPLTRLTYENVVFFSWVWAQDPKLMFKIISAMPVGGNEAAQQKALVGVIPAADLSRFVRDFLDNKVATPGGADPMFGQIPLQMTTNIGAVTVTANDTRELDAQPFTMFAVDATFEGGSYSIEVQDKGPVLAQHRDAEAGDWAAGPIEVTGDCGTSVTHRLAGMATGPAKVQVAAKMAKTDTDCKACGGRSVRDQCLVGTWLIDNVVEGMSISDYLSNGRPVGTIVVGKNALKFDENGDSVWGYQNFLIAVQDSLAGSPVAGAVLNGTIDQSWSAADGQLNTCFVSADAQIKLATEGGNIGDPVDFNDIGAVQPLEQYAYDCSDTDGLVLEKRLGDSAFLMRLRKLK